MLAIMLVVMVIAGLAIDGTLWITLGAIAGALIVKAWWEHHAKSKLTELASQAEDSTQINLQLLRDYVPRNQEDVLLEEGLGFIPTLRDKFRVLNALETAQEARGGKDRKIATAIRLWKSYTPPSVTDIRLKNFFGREPTKEDVLGAIRDNERHLDAVRFAYKNNATALTASAVALGWSFFIHPGICIAAIIGYYAWPSLSSVYLRVRGHLGAK